MARLFVSQQRLDRWTSEGKVTLTGEVMALPALGRSFRLRPAFYFTRVVSEGGDDHDLIGRVKTAEQLAAIGADTYANSVIVGETAYDGEPGFVGEVVGGAGLGPSGIPSGIDKLEP